MATLIMSAFTNLPGHVPSERLREFTFGNPDAAHDDLIKETMCVCAIRPIEEFLKDAKPILVGDKGTGKTGVFELLRENKIKFAAPSDVRQIIIPIDQQLDYRTLKDRIVSHIVSGVKDETLRYRAVWELLILYFVIQKIKALGELPADLDKGIAEFEEAFPLDPHKKGVIEVLLAAKKKIGIKFETSPVSGLPIPDLYASFETDPTTTGQATDGNLLRLGPLKESINLFLKSCKTRIYVLVDRIDEFLIKEEYDIQRLTLQGLLGCERSYRTHKHIRLKLFLRRDLFLRSDLSEFGADKVVFDSLELTWSAEDIRDFLSKRVLYNYLRVLQLSTLRMRLNEENLYVDRQSNERPSEEQRTWWQTALIRCRRIGRKWRRVLKHHIFRKPFDRWEGRHTNFNDEVNCQIIETFFPTEVWRGDPDAPKKAIPLTEFLATHLNLSFGNTTPRIMLMFAQQCVDTGVSFYQKNPDIAGAKPFPMLTKDIVLQAYQEFKTKMWSIMALEGKQWKTDIEAFRGNFAMLPGLAFDQVQTCFPTKSDKELDELLAVLHHLGILSCVNKELPMELRYYSMPLLFRQGEAAMGIAHYGDF